MAAHGLPMPPAAGLHKCSILYGPADGERLALPFFLGGGLEPGAVERCRGEIEGGAHRVRQGRSLTPALASETLAVEGRLYVVLASAAARGASREVCPSREERALASLALPCAA